jgi:hypothetical protein
VLANGSYAARVCPEQLNFVFYFMIYFKYGIDNTLNVSFASHDLAGHLNIGFTSIFSTSSASAISSIEFA